MRTEPDAVEKVVCPDTVNVPLEVRDVVAVITPPIVFPAEMLVIEAFVAVKLVIIAVAAFKRVAKKLDEVAFVRIEFCAKKFVVVAEVKRVDDAPRSEIKA